MSARLFTSKRARALIYYLCGGQCAKCGDPLPDGWHADHIVPHAAGGETTVHNAQPLCPACNRKKSDHTMQFRRFQKEFYDLIRRKIEGGASAIHSLLALVVPGGGKSVLPAILALLANHTGSKICWVAPRVSLMRQGAQDFQEPWVRRLVGHTGEIRETQNDVNPTRGKLGYLTTYHAIGQNPELHAQEFQRHDYLLFCDEIHHVARGSSWESALRPLVERSAFRVFATGTLSRGDKEQIAFLPYRRSASEGGYVVDTEARPGWAKVEYPRSEAVSDGAILPLNFRILDGTAQWTDRNGRDREVSSLRHLDGSDACDALNTFLETDAALEILDEAVRSWEKTREEFAPARLLVAAPNRQKAREYSGYIEEQHGHDCGLAIIDDSGGNGAALEAINRFRPTPKGTGQLQILVTVGMAYEGLSVKPITEIACLTRYRTRGWIEQLFARGNRVMEGKPNPSIFQPDDPFLEEIRKEIEEEERAAVPVRKALEENPDANEESGSSKDSGSGPDKDSIVPLASQVLRERGIYNGDEIGYDLTETVKAAMDEAGINGVHPGKVAEILKELGLDPSDLARERSTAGHTAGGHSAEKRSAGGHASREGTTLTPREREKRLRKKISKRVRRFAAGNPDADFQDVNQKLCRRFGPREEMTEEELRECWSFVQEKL